MKIINSKDNTDYNLSLRKCPFCDSDAQIWESNIWDLPFMGCKNTGCLVKPVVNYYKIMDKIRGKSRTIILPQMAKVWNYE